MTAKNEKTALVIRTDGTVGVTALDTTHELSAMQEAVGGYIQLVPVADESLSCFCNEEGKITGLEYNPLATLFVGDYLAPGDWIAGDLLIMGKVDSRGETLGLTERQFEGVIARLTMLTGEVVIAL